MALLYRVLYITPWIGPDLAVGSLGDVRFEPVGGLAAIGSGLMAYAAVLGVASVFSERMSADVAPRLAPWIRRLALLGISIVVFALVVPIAIDWTFGDGSEATRDGTGTSGAVSSDGVESVVVPSPGTGGDGSEGSVIEGIVAFLTAAASAGLAAVTSLVVPVSGDDSKASRRPVTRLLRLVWRVLLRLFLLAAAFLAPIAAVYLVGVSIHYVFYVDLWGIPGLALVAVIVASIFFVLYSEPHAWSLHHYYRDALSDCFLMWQRDSATPQAFHEDGARDEKLLRGWLPHVSGVPELLICATANLSNYGDSEAGMKSVPFVFSSEDAGVPGVGGRMKKRDWYDVGRPAGLLSPTSMPEAMTTAAAAISPSMGKFGAGAVASMIGALNLRLGSWMRNPLGSAPELMVRGRFMFRSRYLLKELRGRGDKADRFVYVTDGGHYENLGLLELLRRRCDRIWCVDASGDGWGGISELAAAMRLAEGSLGVLWDDSAAGELARFHRDEQVHGQLIRRTSATLRGSYRSGEPRQEFEVRVVKIGLDAASPTHLRDYQVTNGQFPYHSTANQFFDAATFDAYVGLGRSSTSRALEHATPWPV